MRTLQMRNFLLLSNTPLECSSQRLSWLLQLKTLLSTTFTVMNTVSLKKSQSCFLSMLSLCLWFGSSILNKSKCWLQGNFIKIKTISLNKKPIGSCQMQITKWGKGMQKSSKQCGLHFCMQLWFLLELLWVWLGWPFIIGLTNTTCLEGVQWGKIFQGEWHKYL